MALDWKGIGQFALDLAIDGGKHFVKEMEKNTKKIEKATEKKAKESGSRVSDEMYARFDEMYEKIDNAQTAMEEAEERYHSRFRYGSYDTYDEEDTYFDLNNDEEEEYSAIDSTELLISMEEKIERQLSTASKEYSFSKDTLEEVQDKWKDCGLLKDVELLEFDQSTAGLIQLKINNEIVYITRVIEIKSGGFRKKISDLKTVVNIRNRKLQKYLSANVERISIETLVVGSSEDDIDYVRSLEKALILTYKPKWL